MTLAISHLINYCSFTGFIPRLWEYFSRMYIFNCNYFKHYFNRLKVFLAFCTCSRRKCIIVLLERPPAFSHILVRYQGLGQGLGSSVNIPVIKLQGVIIKWHVSHNHINHYHMYCLVLLPPPHLRGKCLSNLRVPD